MTKFAVISDLHLRHWSRTSAGGGIRKLFAHLKASFDENQPDCILGDLERNDLFEEKFAEIPRIHIPGNHEYYSSKFDGAEKACRYDEYNGVRIVSATLWTNFNNDNPVAHHVVGQGMNDFHLIEDFTTQDAYNAHKYHLEFLKKHIKDGVDIVMTHHAPSFQSHHPADPINDGYMSNLDELVHESGAKFWIHGHIHWTHDYTIGKTRVILNACGYPHERSCLYLPVYIEV